MKKVNFNTVYNDFGDTLPSKSEFFNDPRNEVTRVMLRHHYGISNDWRAFKRFQIDYAKFVAELKAKASKKPVKTGASTKPKVKK